MRSHVSFIHRGAVASTEALCFTAVTRTDGLKVRSGDIRLSVRHGLCLCLLS
jgi:hypothetical protein